MIEIKKLCILSIAILGFSVNCLYGTVSDSVLISASTLSGTTMDIVTIGNSVSNLGVAATGPIPFASFNISSNHISGFRVTLKSLGVAPGTLSHTAESGSGIPYTLHSRKVSGSLANGLTVPAPIIAAPMTVPVTLVYSGTPTEATIAYTVELDFTCAVLASMLAGMYTDIVQITLVED
jgi:hypothetical protein